jgi:hypothetical protein
MIALALLHKNESTQEKPKKYFKRKNLDEAIFIRLVEETIECVAEEEYAASENLPNLKLALSEVDYKTGHTDQKDTKSSNNKCVSFSAWSIDLFYEIEIQDFAQQ